MIVIVIVARLICLGHRARRHVPGRRLRRYFSPLSTPPTFLIVVVIDKASSISSGRWHGGEGVSGNPWVRVWWLTKTLTELPAAIDYQGAPQGLFPYYPPRCRAAIGGQATRQRRPISLVSGRGFRCLESRPDRTRTVSETNYPNEYPQQRKRVVPLVGLPD